MGNTVMWPKSCVSLEKEKGSDRMSDVQGKAAPLPEPWLRGTLTDVPAVGRAILHALELTQEDVNRWCESLNEADLHARLFDLPSVAFHLRHIARSLDRLLTYAEGNQLSANQVAALKSEMHSEASREDLFVEFSQGLELAMRRVRALVAGDLEQLRLVGKKQLPTSIGGLLVHIADHTQRHVGQIITTAKILLAARPN